MKTRSSVASDAKSPARSSNSGAAHAGPLHTFLNIGLGAAWGVLGLSVFYGKSEASSYKTPPACVQECRTDRIASQPGSVRYALDLSTLRKIRDRS